LFEKGTAIVVEQCPECRFVVVGDCKASMGGSMKKSVYKRFSLQQYVRGEEKRRETKRREEKRRESTRSDGHGGLAMLLCSVCARVLCCADAHRCPHPSAAFTHTNKAPSVFLSFVLPFVPPFFIRYLDPVVFVLANGKNPAQVGVAMKGASTKKKKKKRGKKKGDDARMELLSEAHFAKAVMKRVRKSLVQVADQPEFQKRCLKYTWCVVLQCGGHRGGKNCKKRETDGRWEALMEAHRRVQVNREEEKRRGSCSSACVVACAAVQWVCGGVLSRVLSRTNQPLQVDTHIRCRLLPPPFFYSSPPRRPAVCMGRRAAQGGGCIGARLRRRGRVHGDAPAAAAAERYGGPCMCTMIITIFQSMFRDYVQCEVFAILTLRLEPVFLAYR
jgi:hypothetical protein